MGGVELRLSAMRHAGPRWPAAEKSTVALRGGRQWRPGSPAQTSAMFDLPRGESRPGRRRPNFCGQLARPPGFSPPRPPALPIRGIAHFTNDVRATRADFSDSASTCLANRTFTACIWRDGSAVTICPVMGRKAYFILSRRGPDSLSNSWPGP